MKLPAITLTLLPVVVLTGCTARKPAAAPPPVPVAVKPQPPPGPLSIPQTTAQLPSPQPVNPEAIPPLPPPQPAPEKAEAPLPRTPKRPAPKTTETAAEPEQPAAAAPAETAPAPFQPIVTPQEQSRLKNSIEAHRREIDDRLKNVKHPSPHDQGLIDRIKSFETLSASAAQRGDYTQADALLERASILAKELPVE